MCGITGVVGGDRAEDLGTIVAGMSAALAHRGPDDAGVWSDPAAGIAMGHRRLSIVDLSAAGHQPMLSASGRYVISFNGEIYNYRAIRKELEALGVAPQWRGHADTEVLLASVEHWGLQPALNRFKGMFAFALWDRTQRVLHLARDRLGEKPLYFGFVGEILIFGSELKALRAHPNWQGEVDRSSLSCFMRYNCVPTPYSIYRHVFKLYAGSFLSIPCGDHRRLGEYATPDRATRYWDARTVVERASAEPLDVSDTEAVDSLESILGQAVSAQMEADVPLGAFLSGGIDSTAVVASMQAHSSRPVKTFSIGFEDPEYDEAASARRVASHLRTDHTELYLSVGDAIDVIPSLPALYDEPFADASQIPTYLVSKLARSKVTVSLSGDGGDELFGGYNRYIWISRFFGKGWMPRLARNSLRLPITTVLSAGGEGALEALLPERLKPVQMADKLVKLGNVLRARSADEAYLLARSIWDEPGQVVYQGDAPEFPGELGRQPDMDDAVQRMMYFDLVSYLPDDILVKLDRASMGVSLESRLPFLDHDLVEFAWRLPLSLKIRDGQTKWLVRQLLRKHVPEGLLQRPKMGFSIPLQTWLRGPLREWAQSLLQGSALRADGYFDPQIVQRRWTEHVSGRRNWQHQLWQVLMFQAWLAAERGGGSAAVDERARAHG